MCTAQNFAVEQTAYNIYLAYSFRWLYHSAQRFGDPFHGEQYIIHEYTVKPRFIALFGETEKVR